MGEHDEATRDSGLFRITMHLVAEKIPPDVLGLLWTVHRMYGEWVCPAHTHGQECCVDWLLENNPQPPASHKIDDLASIILAGYDIIIESAGPDRGSEVQIYLIYQGQRPNEHLKFAASPVTLGEGIKKAREHAIAFPQVS
jgi:hypothetical protein